ncbi:cyclic pyranopterin phosphate synthase [Filimonas lacunae]|uniref:GTP 3',8-cyclase n=1 Tax=Filimonas lacunae TaxID=477680 RepID=A0A1N7QY22_9BACT|nr:GTP 3',8-cyclase MoaA [Filimonas lacunae]SIT27347.1 cyclic pyranopterin phosphate synthase [Filimonas lacunae]
MLQDSFGRLHTYLRISLTDQCNFRCQYCLPDESETFMPPHQLMQAKEVMQLAEVFCKMGITKIRITGGEPLIRKDATSIIQQLSTLPVSLHISTNGTRIHTLLPLLQKGSISSVNISLDSLDAATFRQITRRNVFQLIVNNIDLLLQYNIPVKINAVIIKGINDHEINDFVAWTKRAPIHIRFIEFMPFTYNQWSHEQVYTCQGILAQIQQQYILMPAVDSAGNTAQTYTLPGHQGTVGVISTISQPFCSTCNRIRLTADGKMKNCLFSAGETDLLTALREGRDVASLIQQNLLGKAAERGGQFTAMPAQLNVATLQNRSMIAIGG